MPKQYLFLLIAVVFETVGTTNLQASQQFTRLWPTVITAVLALGSFWLLSLAMKSLPVGTAYAVWVGIGAALTVVYAMITGEEPVSLVRILLIMGLVGCIVGLKLVGGDTPKVTQ